MFTLGVFFYKLIVPFRYQLIFCVVSLFLHQFKFVLSIINIPNVLMKQGVTCRNDLGIPILGLNRGNTLSHPVRQTG